MDLIFFTLLICLTLAHFIFFLRPLIFKNFKPKPVDRVAKLLSHTLLPIVSILSLFATMELYLHIVALMPLVLIVISQFIRGWIRKHYLLLPLVNGAIFIGVLICL